MELTLRVITPERIVVDTTVDSVRVPGLDGGMGIFPRHAPMATALDAGFVRYRSGGQERVLFTDGGFAEVRGGTVRVLTSVGEQSEEIDFERARKAEERARERLAHRGETLARESGVDFLRAEAALRRSLLRQQLGTDR
ncbi:MAG: ATP synthase F1 subunit epsilon [Planctomycetota bacterium]|jgi:F-type H+-transporting ATPase subunit epsilon|nr:ATP synthase F1 subunit epsilon [Planctomycetota bacterium]MDP6761413.1 ATP synthase F1 subunit epsilon [Planctomycetota bacterium]MDP6987893.1 ATP synthase F1 subunit epsilon [Planctomycetota bacterium]